MVQREEKEPELDAAGEERPEVCSKAWPEGFGTDCWHQEAKEFRPEGKRP